MHIPPGPISAYICMAYTCATLNIYIYLLLRRRQGNENNVNVRLYIRVHEYQR